MVIAAMLGNERIDPGLPPRHVEMRPEAEVVGRMLRMAERLGGRCAVQGPGRI